MSIYALIDHQRVTELFETDGDITQMFHPSFIWINVDSVAGIAEGWAATQTGTDWVFAPYGAPPPTEVEVIAANINALQFATQLATAQKTALTNRIATLQDAIDNVGIEGMEEFSATPEEQLEFPKRKTQLSRWKNYAIMLGRVTAQTGWALTVTWPAQPSEGMDLSVSAVTPETV